MNQYLDVLKKYAVFSGRARRQEFWLFVLFSILVSIVLAVLDAVLGTNGILGAIYSLAIVIPSLAVGARRLHDTGRSGWWQLIAIVPLIGTIVLIVFWATEGEPNPNKYGPNPKYAPAA
ncbi:DUF805 domain-containing protein [Streptomyces sp. WAC06614]|uniref:DUF805 domain-containing protein n=1 Tax=Streptomyces sp. WAC06614 TaxID=2487416 RepID=UPI000F7993C7|nr:DUF805 domain-containing protein [Streptomyces sp. WAC06614]RSS84129.1 DUF805 domain-containing protein [Streptomyces sp. WAC06614]